MVNAKKSVSSYQLARDLSLNQKTAWSMMMKIRNEMSRKNETLLQGIVEADETYLGTRASKSPKAKKEGEETEEETESDNKYPKKKRGRGANKNIILGVVERGGKVVAELVKDATGETIYNFISKHVRTLRSVLITDQYRGYSKISRAMRHYTINHDERYVDRDIHTNTIEGFWSLLKRAWRGTHHHYSTGYLPMYLAEACYKYNNRDNENVFLNFIRNAMRL